MKNKIILLVISGVVLSFSSLCQTPEKSLHPKLDALFPHSKNPTATKISDSTATPAANNITDNSTLPAKSIPNTTTVPTTNIVTDNTIKPANAVTYQNQPQSEPQKQTETKPEKKEIYRDTRLGSSTQQYDTYEKNEYGAGSVTTSPK